MNKCFKSIWSDARQAFVTTSEVQKSHGKRSKSALSIALATSLLIGAASAVAAYVETGALQQCTLPPPIP